MSSRPLHEGVDWNYGNIWHRIQQKCRPLHEGVDWNTSFPIYDEAHRASPSSRGRGLKYLQYFKSVTKLRVALFTRAWIEIRFVVSEFGIPKSPSSRGRGLKYHITPLKDCYQHVALFTRAWIEIANADYKEILTDVALFTRAWIEMLL